jgi:hypothetical protein
VGVLVPLQHPARNRSQQKSLGNCRGFFVCHAGEWELIATPVAPPLRVQGGSAKRPPHRARRSSRPRSVAWNLRFRSSVQVYHPSMIQYAGKPSCERLLRVHLCSPLPPLNTQAQKQSHLVEFVDPRASAECRNLRPPITCHVQSSKAGRNRDLRPLNVISHLSQQASTNAGQWNQL